MSVSEILRKLRQPDQVDLPVTSRPPPPLRDDDDEADNAELDDDLFNFWWWLLSQLLLRFRSDGKGTAVRSSPSSPSSSRSDVVALDLDDDVSWFGA